MDGASDAHASATRRMHGRIGTGPRLAARLFFACSAGADRPEHERVGGGGGGGGGAPTAPAAEPGCEWVLLGEQISLPEMPTSFPPNLDFTLPPIPKLLPSWQQLQSLAEERRAEERRAEQQRAEQQRAEQQRAEQQRAVAVMEGLASTHTHLPLKMAHLPWEISQLPMEVAPLLRLEPTRVPQGPARMHNSAPPAMLGGIAGFGLASAVVLGLVSSRRSGHRAKLRASSLRSEGDGARRCQY